MSNVLIALLVYLSQEKRFAIILQELDFKIKTLSQIHYSYAYVCTKINCVKVSIRYVYMSFSQAIFRQQLSSNLDSCPFFLITWHCIENHPENPPNLLMNEVQLFYYNRFFHIINIIFWLTLFSQHKNFSRDTFLCPNLLGDMSNFCGRDSLKLTQSSGKLES